MPKEQDGIAFLKPGEVDGWLPHVIRSRDSSGIVRAFLEAIRRSHNATMEHTRVVLTGRDPMQVGKFYPENYSEDPEEWAKWVLAGRVGEPPVDLRESSVSQDRISRLMSIMAAELGCLYPVEAFPEQVFR